MFHTVKYDSNELNELNKMNIINLLSRERLNSSRLPVLNVSKSTNNESIAKGSLAIHGDHGRSWTLPRQEEDQAPNQSQERNFAFTSLQKSKMMESFPIKVCLSYCNLQLLLFLFPKCDSPSRSSSACYKIKNTKKSSVGHVMVRPLPFTIKRSWKRLSFLQTLKPASSTGAFSGR